MSQEDESLGAPVEPQSEMPCQTAIDVSPKGVGGWLLFFCVGLTILAPVFSAYQIITGWSAFEDTDPAFRMVIVFEDTASVLLVAFGVYVGANIWKGSVSGKKLARQFLVVWLLGTFSYEIIVFLMLAHLNSNGQLTSEAFVRAGTSMFGIFFRSSVYFTVWWQYFNKSKRVQNTYPL